MARTFRKVSERFHDYPDSYKLAINRGHVSCGFRSEDWTEAGGDIQVGYGDFNRPHSKRKASRVASKARRRSGKKMLRDFY